MSKLGDLLVALGEDHTTLAQFAQHPEAVMQHYGLSDEEKDAVRSKDITKLQAAHPRSDLLIMAKECLLIMAQEPPQLVMGHHPAGD
jgi:hypothetical protein